MRRETLMHALLNPANIIDWLGDWGYLGIFVCVFIGNLGIPVPEETVMLVAGFLAGRAILEPRVRLPRMRAERGHRRLLRLFCRAPRRAAYHRAAHRRFVDACAIATSGSSFSSIPMAARRSSWRASSPGCASWRDRWRVRRGCRFCASSDGTCWARSYGARRGHDRIPGGRRTLSGRRNGASRAAMDRAGGVVALLPAVVLLVAREKSDRRAAARALNREKQGCAAIAWRILRMLMLARSVLRMRSARSPQAPLSERIRSRHARDFSARQSRGRADRRRRPRSGNS